MKALALTLIACTLSGVAMANNAKCRETVLNFNTHPAVDCPDYIAFCTEDLEGGDMTIEKRSGGEDNFRFMGLSRRNYSDVGGAIFNSYYGAGDAFMEVHFETDNSYPVSRTGGYTNISLSTGVRGNSGVYVSQICGYEIK